MKRFSLAILFALSTQFVGAQTSFTVKDAVVKVYVTSANSKLVSTGFFVSNTGHILTCAHVLKKPCTICVQTHLSQKLYDAVIIACDEKQDLALLQLTPNAVHDFEKTYSSIPSLSFAHNDASLADFVKIIGLDLNNEIACQAAKVEGSYTLTHRDMCRFIGKFITYTAYTEPGSSGSPILNACNEVVGMHHGGNPDPAITPVFIPNETILPWLKNIISA